MPAPAKPAVANQILLEYNAPEYARLIKAIGYARLDLGRDATAQEAEDYVATVVDGIVFGYEKAKAADAAVAAVAKITRK